MLFLAGVINAIGVTIFIAPVQLYDSGISGTSILLSQLTPDTFSLSFFLILLNIPLLLLGFKRQGAVFSVYAIFTVGVYSAAAWLITDVLPVDVSIASPLAGTDLFLCALFGGIVSGVGSGLAIRYGGAMDGIEVAAVIFAKGSASRSVPLCWSITCCSTLYVGDYGQLDSAAVLDCHLCGGLQNRGFHRGRSGQLQGGDDCHIPPAGAGGGCRSSSAQELPLWMRVGFIRTRPKAFCMWWSTASRWSS